MIHVPGKLLSAPDTLSHCPNLLLANNKDNSSVTLLPDTLFINLIDTPLSSKLAASTASDPVILTALQSMSGEVPPAFCSCLSDWHYDTSVDNEKGVVLTYRQMPKSSS